MVYRVVERLGMEEDRVVWGSWGAGGVESGGLVARGEGFWERGDGEVGRLNLRRWEGRGWRRYGGWLRRG